MKTSIQLVKSFYRPLEGCDLERASQSIDKTNPASIYDFYMWCWNNEEHEKAIPILEEAYKQYEKTPARFLFGLKAAECIVESQATQLVPQAKKYIDFILEQFMEEQVIQIPFPDKSCIFGMDKSEVLFEKAMLDIMSGEFEIAHKTLRFLEENPSDEDPIDHLTIFKALQTQLHNPALPKELLTFSNEQLYKLLAGYNNSISGDKKEIEEFITKYQDVLNSALQESPEQLYNLQKLLFSIKERK